MGEDAVVAVDPGVHIAAVVLLIHPRRPRSVTAPTPPSLTLKARRP